MKSGIVIPDGWEIKKLGEISEIRGGKRLPKCEKLVENKTNFPYIRVSDFKKGSVDVKNILYLKPEIHEKIKRYTISSNDVYISIAGTIGLVGTISKELDGANLTENAAKLTNLKSITKNFLSYYLESSLAQSQIERLKGKTSQPKLALERIRRIKILVPDINEQQKIADILSKVDEQIDLTEKIISKTEELKKGLMQKLLTKGIGHTKFKKTEIGEIPKEWGIRKLNESTVINPNYNFTKNKEYDYIPMDSVAVNFNGVKCKHRKVYNYSSGSKIKNGDVIFAKITPCIENGKIALVTGLNSGYAIGSTEFIVFSSFDFLDSTFLFFQLCSKRLHRKAINLMEGTTGRQRVNKNVFGHSKIVIPPLKEQKQIASILSKVDEQIQDNKKELNRLRKLKKGLMQDLLTGKVRVTV